MDATFTAADGVRIAYRDHGGEGRGLVLLHGGAANLVSMDQYAQRLGIGRRTVAMDARGCGLSGDPAHVRLVDMADDVAELVEKLDLGAVDVIGHSMGGFVAGFYATRHAQPTDRVVSIDGFGPGTVSRGTSAQRQAFAEFQRAMKAAFFAMTEPPELGSRGWRDEEIAQLCAVLPRIGYTAPNVQAMAERNFIDLPDGRFRRHPSRQLFEDVFADGETQDVLRMYRDARCPALIIRCTESDAPEVLDLELDALVHENANVEIVRLPLTHLAPAWDELDMVAARITEFFGRVPA